LEEEPSIEDGKLNPDQHSDNQVAENEDLDGDGNEIEDIDPAFASDLYNHFNAGEQEDRDLFHGIVGHKWRDGLLLLRVELAIGEGNYEWIPFETLKADEPVALAEYIVKNSIDCPKTGRTYKTGSGKRR
jgi:hypothetical protein